MNISRRWPQKVLLHDHGDGSITILRSSKVRPVLPRFDLVKS